MKLKKLILPGSMLLVAAAVIISSIFWRQTTTLKIQNAADRSQISQLNEKIDELQNEDQRQVNKKLKETLLQMQTSFKKSISVYENLVDLHILSKSAAKLDTDFANALNLVAASNYASGSAKLDQLAKDIAAEKQKLTVLPTNIPAPVNNTPPSSGYSIQSVQTGVGTFVVNIISADLASTKVIVDTASESDCVHNCPVLPLGTYVARSGAYAGVNGSYFCPATYPTCAGKTNSFDLLVMNKNKHYFNSDNNVYSNNPAVIFGSGYIRFVGSASEWGRDTGIDGVLSNYPLLVRGGSVTFGGNDDPKQGSAGNRSFVAHRGNTIYIGVVRGVTVVQMAHVMKTLGMDDALNLDDGGSTALWSGGYKVGPGRDLPNVILFVRK